MTDKTLYIIDGHSQLYKAYYAIRRLSNSKGLPTNAIFGFIQILNRIVREFDPAYLVIVFDYPAPTFRNEIYKEYKANRPPPPEDLKQQQPLLKEILRAMKLHIIEKEGYEADDVIGTLSEMAVGKGFKVAIFSSDKDLFQLVNDNVYTIRIHGDRVTLYTPEKVKEEMGVPPEKIIDLLGLMGDTSDNIPGIPKVGPKSATAILNQVDSAEEAIEHPDKIKEEKFRKRIREYKDNIVLSKKLATIVRNVPLEESVEQFRWRFEKTPELINYYKEMEFTSFLREAGEESTAESVRDVSYSIITTEKDLEAFVKRAMDAPLLALDTETTSAHPMDADLVGISLSVKKNEAVYIPVGHEPLHAPEQITLERVRTVLKPLLEGDTPKCGHNIKYDVEVLGTHGFTVRNITHDSMIAGYLLNPDKRSFGLKNMADETLKIRMTHLEELIGKGKNQITMAQVDVNKAADYACADADITLQLSITLKEQIAANKLEEIYHEIEIPLLSVLADMESVGVKIDKTRLTHLSIHIKKRIDELTGEIYESAGREFKINSPKQVGGVLFEDLKLKPVKTGKSGAFSTDESVLEALSEEHPLPKLILEYRALDKLKSTYVDSLPALINPRTGKIHTSYNQTVAATGRLSSSNPNLQNIPVRTEQGREIRRAFIPSEEGNVFLSADYSQIELRILAHMSGDTSLKEAFTKGDDIHLATAVRLFSVEPEHVTKEMRDRAKVVNFGVLYGMTASRLSREFNISRTEGQHIINEYFKSFPSVQEWIDEVIAAARKNGYVTTLSGRRRYIPDIKASSRAVQQNAERVVINTPVQGTSADMIKKAMISIHRELAHSKTKAKMVLQVHDELIFDIPEDEVETLSPVIVRYMENALPLRVPLKVDIKTGNNWAEC